MPHEQARAQDTRAWLRKARADLESAEILVSGSRPQLGNAAFHCQQAAEKAFKGFLAWHDQSFRKTHNLEELGRQIAGIDPTLETLVDRTATLTEYASAFRYPGESEDPSREEVEAALALAREAYEAILARLPEDVRP